MVRFLLFGGSLGTASAESTCVQSMGWVRTVDRRLVHRNAIAEVLLTDLIQTSAARFEVAAQWPRSHRVYRPNGEGRHDPMLILETVRQTGLALSHFGFGVDFDQRSVMRDVGFSLDTTLEPRSARSATNLEIAVRCENISRRGSALRSMTVVLDFAVNGTIFATGTGGISWVSARVYQALRARSAPLTAVAEQQSEPARATPHASTNRSAADALITLDTGSAQHVKLVIPKDHPVYFDHQLDHAPGMLLIDAAWQAASAIRGDSARLVGAWMQCPAFTELNLSTSIDLKPTPGGAMTFSVEQGGRETASGTLEIAG